MAPPKILLTATPVIHCVPMGAFKELVILELRSIRLQLGRIEKALSTQDQEIKTMSTASKQAIADLTASIAAEKTVVDGTAALVDGAVTILKDLSQQLADAGTDATALADLKTAVDAQAAELSGAKDKLSAAVVTGTPAAPPAPPADAPTT